MSLDVPVLGLVNGLVYALMAMGLVLVFKSGRYLNFAQGNMGTIAATLLAKLVVDFRLPYWPSLVAALAAAAVLAGLAELLVVRRLFRAPRLVLTVGTIGIGTLFLALPQIEALAPRALRLLETGYPVPFTFSANVGSLRVLPKDFMTILLVPLVAAGLGAFLRFTSYGQAIRASADNPDAARLAGISVRRMSTLVWVLAGVLSALGAILLAPGRSLFLLGSLGPTVLVRALAAGLIARMSSLSVTFFAAVGIGLVEAFALSVTKSGGTTELAVFAVVAVALAVRARDLARASREGGEGVAFGAEPKPLPRDVAALPGVRRVRAIGVLASLAAAVALPFVPVFGLNTQAKAFLFTLTAGYAIVGLSLCLLTGWGGQVSLGQFALVGVGAFAFARLLDAGVPFPAAVPAAALVGAAVAALVGLPAMRIQGLFLAVTTLAFGVLATGWVFQRKAFVGDPSGVYLGRPDALSDERTLYLFAVGLAAVAVVAVRNFRRAGPGRALIAARDNDRLAQASGVSPAGARLVGFALSGFLAGLAGVVFALARQRYNATSFDPSTSLTVLAMVIVGGLGSIPGAVLGAVFVFGLPSLFTGNALVALLVSGLGLLVFLLYVPGGIVSVVYAARDGLVDRAVRRARGLPSPPSIVPPLRDLFRVARGRPLEPSTAEDSPAVRGREVLVR